MKYGDKILKDGTLCHINFGKNAIGGEINAIHLAVLFSIPGVENVIFAVPLTSPKEKHFRSEKDFVERNYLETRFFRLHYIRQTDSIALLEQLKSISPKRIFDIYKDADHNDVVLNDRELEILKAKIKKYIDYVLK